MNIHIRQTKGGIFHPIGFTVYNFSLNFLHNRFDVVFQGLLQAIDMSISGAEYRYCLRHLHANFKDKFRGKVYKDGLWAATEAYNEASFKERMAHVRNI